MDKFEAMRCRWVAMISGMTNGRWAGIVFLNIPEAFLINENLLLSPPRQCIDSGYLYVC